MASNNKIKGLTIELNGDTTGFKAALDSADKSLRVTQGELKALKEGLKIEWDSSKFSKAQDLAKKAVEETNQKVEILRKGLVELEKQGLDNTNDDFRKLTKEIAYAENVAKRAQNELSTINKLKFDNAEKQLKSMDNTLNTVAKGAAVVGAAFIASGTAAVKLGLDAIKTADDIATTAVQLGITTEQLQKYQYLAMQTDVSNESLSKAFVKLNADVGNLALGIEDSGNKALVKLIGSVKNADGSLKDSEQVFYEVISTLQSMGNEAERTGYLTQIFGEKMGKDLNPMLSMSVDELKALEDEFYNVGYLTDENVSKLADMDNTLNETRAIIKQVSLEAGVELLPVFEEFEALVRENKNEIKSFAVDTVKNIVNVITTVYEMRGAIAAAAAVFGVLKAAVAIASIIITTQKAMEGYTIATKAAELANKALAVSTALTPWGAIITALAAVAAGVLAYNLATGGAKTETDKLSESIKQIKESYDSAIESIDDRTNSQQAELTIADKLIDKYEELNDKVNKTTAEKAELTRIVEQINAILPDAIGKINEETGAYETQTEALRQLVEQKRQNARETAAMSKATEMQSTILDYEDTLSQAESRFSSLGKGVSYAEIEQILTAPLGSARDRERSFVAAKYGLSAKEVKELEKSYQQILNLKDEINRLNKKVGDLLSTTSSVTDDNTTDPGPPPAPYAIIENDDTRKSYDTIRNRKNLELSAGLITEQQYYNELEAAQGEYLAAYSDAWLKSEAEIQNGRKRIREAAEKVAEDARNKELKAKEKADAEAAKKAEAARKAAEKAVEDARKVEEKALADKAKAAADKAKEEEKAAEKAKKDAEEAAKARIAEYESKRDDLEYYIDLDLITEAEYYEELAKLRDEYFEENSKEWRKITVAIYNFKREMEEKELAAQKKAAEEYLKSVEDSNAAVQKQIEETYNEQIKAIEAALAEKKALYNEETKAIQDSLKEQQSAYKAEYEAKRKQIDSELELERKRINTIINAIDEEVSARRRLRETESADDKVTAAQKALEAAQLELEYARTEYEKAELAKEVQRRQNELDAALLDREDTLFYQQKQLEKEAAQAELDAKIETANSQKDAAQSSMENTIARIEAEAQARLKEIEALIAAAESAAEASKQAAESAKMQETAALAELKQATNYSNVDYMFMTEEQRALQNLVNSVYRSAIATANNVEDVKRATETINSIVNNNTKNANVTLNSTSAPTSGQVALMVEKALDKL